MRTFYFAFIPQLLYYERNYRVNTRVIKFESEEKKRIKVIRRAWDFLDKMKAEVGCCRQISRRRRYFQLILHLSRKKSVLREITVETCLIDCIQLETFRLILSLVEFVLKEHRR